MRYARNYVLILLASLALNASFCFSAEGLTEEQKREAFLVTYNGLRADKRLAALRQLENSKEQRSFETLYFVSFRDPDPEIRSRAFTTLVRCDDTYGYIAYLAADSFKREKELGVKLEKAVEMGSLKYKWAPLNELVGFLSTLRWNDWHWGWYGGGSGHAGGYVASGNPPDSPGEPVKPKDANAGYDDGHNREPLRWRTENELMGLFAGVINRLSGTKIESRPRIDQEIVKWWEQKSELWAEYDRKLRAKTFADLKEKETPLKNIKDLRDDDIKPGKDTLRDHLDRMVDVNPVLQAKDEKPINVDKKRTVTPDDE